MAYQIKLSEVSNHVGKKVKLFAKIMGNPSPQIYVIADSSAYKRLLANEPKGEKHLKVGNTIKILQPEIQNHEIIIGKKTSIFSAADMEEGVIQPPDDVLEKVVSSTVMSPPQLPDELENTVMIESTFTMDPRKVKISK